MRLAGKFMSTLGFHSSLLHFSVIEEVVYTNSPILHPLSTVLTTEPLTLGLCQQLST
jgi:hypothetical protein